MRMADLVVYQVTVNYDELIEKIIEASQYRQYDEKGLKITSERFPPTRQGIENIEVGFVYYDAQTSCDEARQDPDGQGEVFSDALELAALCAAYPDVSQDFAIVALGSERLDQNGERKTPCLFGRKTMRIYGSFTSRSKLVAGCRFAVVLKRSKRIPQEAE